MSTTTSSTTTTPQENHEPVYSFAEDVRPFLRGGLPGRMHLRRVLGSIFAFHAVPQTEQPHALAALGLRPFFDSEAGRMSFALDEHHS